MCKACNFKSIGLAFAVCVTSLATAQAQDLEENLRDVPKYLTPVPYAGVRNWHVTQNLGPTGARAWVLGNRGNSTDSRELLVKSVEPGSPADGILQPYDIIIGAATPPDRPSTQWKIKPTVELFSSDARLSLARAITWAESDAGQGKLELIVQRAGEKLNLTIKLPVMGTYAKTAPYDCPKNDRIVTHAAAFLAEHAPPDGYFNLPGALNALLLYATGDDRYLDLVRRTAMRMSVNHTINDAGHETWRWGYQNMYLSEYYLATGDERVLPTIAEYCKVLAEGQCNPGTWGHRAVPDRVPPGYGSMNQSGLVCFLSMILAEQAGVDVNAEAMANCVNFYGFYAGRGGIPYGDHPPALDATSNGKNGSAAMAFTQIGGDPAGQWFARMCASANLSAFEGGHTGNFFNQTWTPLGASLAGPQNYANFWSRFNSYRDLARRWDGSFVTQPLPHTREGDLGTGNYVRKGPMWTTGGYTLSYLAGNKTLAILGRRESVFGANPPAQLKDALALYDQKKFDECQAALERLVGDDDERVSRLAVQLRTAAKRNVASLELTLADMKKKLQAGDLYQLKWQLQAIESIIDADDARLAAFREAVDDPANAPVLEAGEQYHKLVAGPRSTGPAGFVVYAPSVCTESRTRGSLEQLAAKGPAGYAAMAKAYLAAHPQWHIYPDQPLFDAGAKDAWRMTKAQVTDKDWTSATFDDSTWTPISLPSKQISGKAPILLRRMFDGVDAAAIQSLGLQYSIKGKMDVYLNGTLIFQGQVMGWWKSVDMPLVPAAVELLKADKNVLAIALTPADGDDAFTVSLNALAKQ